MPCDDLVVISRKVEPDPEGAWVGRKANERLLALYNADGHLVLIFDNALELDLHIPDGPENEPIPVSSLSYAAAEDPFAGDDDGVTYFIGGDVGAIKIGRTINVEVRLKDIQACSPIPVRVLALRPGGQRERIYHAHFAAHRLHGEWFAPHPDILEEIDRLNSLPLPKRARAGV